MTEMHKGVAQSKISECSFKGMWHHLPMSRMEKNSQQNPFCEDI